ATSGGLRPGSRTQLELAPLIRYGFELAGVSGRRPQLRLVATAGGDQAHWISWFHDAGRAAGVGVSHLALFPMPNVADVPGFLAEADLVWVGGGSVANLLALWRLHGLDLVFARLWRQGVVLGGVSAGSLCWHVGGTTDSFGPDLRAVTDGLGLIPYANGVHYDSESQRRPLLQRLVAEGTLPSAYATDDGVGLVYRGTELAEVVSETAGGAAYQVDREGDHTREERLEPRLLPDAAPH
ncbi:MAG: Type 1 glutamine amidotransferase-like domain-containing protein, partial [Acidimicrobiales bacterium]